MYNIDNVIIMIGIAVFAPLAAQELLKEKVIIIGKKNYNIFFKF